MCVGARDKAQWLRRHTALAENMGLVPNIHVKQLTATFNSSSRKSNSLFYIPKVHALTCTHTDTHIIHNLISVLIFDEPPY